MRRNSSCSPNRSVIYPSSEAKISTGCASGGMVTSTAARSSRTGSAGAAAESFASSGSASGSGVLAAGPCTISSAVRPRHRLPAGSRLRPLRSDRPGVRMHSVPHLPRRQRQPSPQRVPGWPTPRSSPARPFRPRELSTSGRAHLVPRSLVASRPEPARRPQPGRTRLDRPVAKDQRTVGRIDEIRVVGWQQSVSVRVDYLPPVRIDLGIRRVPAP